MTVRLHALQQSKTGRTIRLRGKRTLAILVILLTIAVFLWLFLHHIAQPAWLMALPGALAELLLLAELAALLTLVALWSVLLWLSRRPARPVQVVPLTVDQQLTLSPQQFEHYVADLFRAKGYTVVVRGRSGDMGVDLEVTAGPGKHAVVQCKRYQNTVGAKTVRELYGTLRHERAAHAFLVTSAEISAAAREWARNKPLTLIDGDTLYAIASALARRVRA